MTHKLYSFHWDLGRMGDIEGLFIADSAAVESALGRKVYFGEVLGKHSSIHGTLQAWALKVLNVSDSTITELREVAGMNVSGYNPLDYVEDENED